jgi:hypothetical protein
MLLGLTAGLFGRSGGRTQRLLRAYHASKGPLAADPEPVPLSKLKDSFNDATSVTYLEELEKRYLEDPGSIDRTWASFFKSLGERTLRHARPLQPRFDSAGPPAWPPRPPRRQLRPSGGACGLRCILCSLLAWVDEQRREPAGVVAWCQLHHCASRAQSDATRTLCGCLLSALPQLLLVCCSCCVPW